MTTRAYVVNHRVQQDGVATQQANSKGPSTGDGVYGMTWGDEWQGGGEGAKGHEEAVRGRGPGGANKRKACAIASVTTAALTANMSA